MRRLNRGSRSRLGPSPTEGILCFLFGLSASIAVLDRLPIFPTIPISVYRILHFPILIGVILLLFSRRQIKWAAYNPTFFLLAGLMLTMTFSTFGAYDQITGLANLLRYFEYLCISILLFLVIRNYWRTSYWIAFSWAMLFTALLSSITILTDFWDVTAFFHWYTAERPYVRHIGILGEANYAAAKLCILLPFILFLEDIYLRWQRRWKVFAVTGAGLIVVLAIFVSGSRMGGLIAMATLGGFLVKKIRRVWQPKVLISFFVAFGLLLIIISFLPQKPLLEASHYLTGRYGILVSFLQEGQEQFHGVRETSLRERIDVFHAGLQMFIAHPLFGIGPGNFPLAIGEYSPNYSSVYSHNTYLSVLAELGVFGFLFFILLCLRMLGSIYKISRSCALQEGNFYPYLLLSCFVLFLIFIFLHDVDSKYLWTVFLPVALFADSLACSTSSTRST